LSQSQAQALRHALAPYCSQIESMVWMMPDADSIIPSRSDCQAGDKPCFDGFLNHFGK